ncbi:MAG TPA: NmrA family NAD(P)-binding protein [Phenylobacterium sp.]|uniref:NmrA family NAD(P)-binding protein n=1 Tax=Phenylobacterium sp. TaxID=1871053 RepID=UPI002B490F22|nr:NmrA family NAD(P)-binding protein [Phenylobacterium sp.]HKR90200.1 NmrA family NAD(P)-binding protein [Phenylobacterium sp.]
MSYNNKPIPKSILIFGAAAHIGGPLAAFLLREAPPIHVRLATHCAAKVDALRSLFPSAEVVTADYFDGASLRAAVDGMEGVFVIAPSGTDEQPAMTNLVKALEASGSLVHLIRLVGLQPEANPRRVPQSLREQRLNLPVQHPIAKQILDASGLPVTYLNCGATFMDNFLVFGMRDGLRRERKLIWPERLIPWIDPRDVAEVAGRLLLSDNHRHIGQFHTLNNGHDLLRFHEVAELMSEAWNEPISYDGSKESFFASYPQIGPRLQVLWDFFQYEQDNEVVWARNDFVERTLGRKPTTLRDWLIEHRDAVLGA